MSSNIDWYDGIAKQIDELKSTITDKDYRKFKLHMLLCVARRTAEFSPGCGQCMSHQQKITEITRALGNLIQISDKEARKSYRKSVTKMFIHLQRKHKLVTEGFYMAICMILSSGLGVAIGVAIDNIGSGIPIGVGIGAAIGAALDVKAKKEGRLICPRETAGSSKMALVLGIILGLLLLVALFVFILFSRSA